MGRLLAFIAAMLLSLLLYLAVFSVIDRPLTLGEIPAMEARKAAYARSLPTPKLAIWAGSNGRYSHRCAAFTQATALPCANLSLAVGIGIDVQLARLEPLLVRGDVLYMPLEYAQYRVERAEMEGGAENAVLVHHWREQLGALPPVRIVRAWGAFDLPFLVHGSIETALDARGFKRRTGIDTLTAQGDESGHTAERGMPYAAFIASGQHDDRPLPVHTHAMDVIAAFLDRMRERGVRVAGGLPTAPADAVLDTAGIARLQALFMQHGQRFIVLPSRSQYPRSCFFDTLSHLNEACQWRHSQAVGERLAAELANWPLP